MIRSSARLGLRMAVRGGSESLLRAAAAAATTAVATFLLLALLAGVHASHAVWDRKVARTPHQSPSGSLLYESATLSDRWHGQPVERILVAATGPTAPLPPGLRAIPAPGEAIVSPRLAELRGQAADVRLRFTGWRVVGAIEPAGLAYPDELVVYEGLPARDVLGSGGIRVDRFGEASTLSGTSKGVRLSALLLFLTFIVAPFAGVCATVTRMSAAARERRLVALRIIGLPPIPIRVATAVEAVAAVAVSTALGVGLFALARPLVRHVRFGGHHVFVSDVSVVPLAALGVAAGVVLVAVASGLLAAGRARSLPTGTRPTVAARRLRRWNIAPLVLGILGLAVAAVAQETESVTGSTELELIAAASILTVGGVAIALPVLSQIAAGFAADHRLPVRALLAARRLDTDPGTVTRVSGLFSATVFAVGFALALNSGFHISDAQGRSQIRRGDRTVASISSAGFPVPIDVVALSRLDRAARVLPRTELIGSGARRLGALIASCDDLRALSASPLEECPRGPVVLASTPPVPGFVQPSPVPVGSPLRLFSADGSRSTTLRWPASRLRLDVPFESGIDGALLVPADSALLTAVGSPRIVEATAIIPPTSRAVDQLRAAVAAVAPTASVQIPGEQIIESARNYASYGRAILLAALMASLVGLAGLFAVAIDSARTRSRQMAALVALGVPGRALRTSCVLELGIPMLVGVAASFGVAIAAGTLYLDLRHETLPTGQLSALALGAGFLTVLFAAVGALGAQRATKITALRSE